nr:MAG TPA: hydrogenase/urease nickel incorporation protein [Caudoviricetes sp.]
MMNHTSYTVQIYCNKHMVHPSINPLTDILLGGFMWKDEYRVSDPFFIVHCKSCGKKYWSTRRSNAVCSFCHSENVYTETPKHTIVKEGG